MHHRWALRPVHHDQLEQVACPVGAEHQVASRILVDLLDKQSVSQGMLDILVMDTMAERRSQDLHSREAYYTTLKGARR